MGFRVLYHSLRLSNCYSKLSWNIHILFLWFWIWNFTFNSQWREGRKNVNLFIRICLNTRLQREIDSKVFSSRPMNNVIECSDQIFNLIHSSSTFCISLCIARLYSFEASLKSQKKWKLIRTTLIFFPLTLTLKTSSQQRQTFENANVPEHTTRPVRRLFPWKSMIEPARI